MTDQKKKKNHVGVANSFPMCIVYHLLLIFFFFRNLHCDYIWTKREEMRGEVKRLKGICGVYDDFFFLVGGNLEGGSTYI